jgi:hypothetical protein
MNGRTDAGPPLLLMTQARVQPRHDFVDNEYNKTTTKTSIRMFHVEGIT